MLWCSVILSRCDRDLDTDRVSVQGTVLFYAPLFATMLSAALVPCCCDSAMGGNSG